MIIDHVNKHGAKDWEILSELTKGERTPEEYANRYNLYIKRYWDEEEDTKIIEMHRILGPNWSEIASNLPYRSAMDVERRYNDIITYELSASVKLDSLIEPIESIKSRPIDFDKFVKYSCYQ